MTQQRGPAPSRPNSSPSTASRGRDRRSTLRSDSSAALSASVTGGRSGLDSTRKSSARKRRVVMSSAASASTWAKRRSSSYPAMARTVSDHGRCGHSWPGSCRSVNAMDYTHLGRSGVSVSRLCLGTMNFGAITSEADAQAIMDAAHEHGINFFDSSNSYGQPRAEGVTESIIGRWMAAGSGRRDRTVLATKLYGGKGEWPNDRFLSALNIRRACDDSLRRLGTDHIDLYQMHHVDRSTPWDEIREAMDVLRTQGKIIYVGSSNFAGWHIRS